MVIFLSISISLVLLEPVNRADSKYVFAVWIGSQIQEIFTADSQSRVKCLSGRFCRGFLFNIIRIESCQIQEIYEKTLTISQISPRCFQFLKMPLEWSVLGVFQCYWYC